MESNNMRSILTFLAAALAATSLSAQQPGVPPGMAVATFAGGCFWCMEPPFDKLPGVNVTAVGYAGGKTPNPTYREVCTGKTGHNEVVLVVFDPKKISYGKILQIFFSVAHDPTQLNRQGPDSGTQYRTTIFYNDEAQRKAAEASKAALEKSKPFKEAIVTPIVMAGAFYPAEEYHQDYYKKNPVRYQIYRSGCGRDARLKQLWGDRASH